LKAQIVVSVIPALLINLQVGFSLYRYLSLCHRMTSEEQQEYLRTVILATCVILAVILQTVDLIIKSWVVSFVIASVWMSLAILSIAVMFALMKIEISRVVSNNLISL
jgi:hypothetical protein